MLVVLVWLASLAGVIYFEYRDTARPASAIIVLGAAQYGGRPSPVLRARLDHAITLWKRGLAPRVVLTGGVGEGDTTSEAAVGMRYALRKGVPDSVMRLEPYGRTTSESMQQVAAMLDAEGKHDIILVSDPFHMLRLTILARRYGLTAYTSPTRSSPISASRRESWKYALSESMKVPLAFFFEFPAN